MSDQESKPPPSQSETFVPLDPQAFTIRNAKDPDTGDSVTQAGEFHMVGQYARGAQRHLDTAEDKAHIEGALQGLAHRTGAFEIPTSPTTSATTLREPTRDELWRIAGYTPEEIARFYEQERAQQAPAEQFGQPAETAQQPENPEASRRTLWPQTVRDPETSIQGEVIGQDEFGGMEMWVIRTPDGGSAYINKATSQDLSSQEHKVRVAMSREGTDQATQAVEDLVEAHMRDKDFIGPNETRYFGDIMGGIQEASERQAEIQEIVANAPQQFRLKYNPDAHVSLGKNWENVYDKSGVPVVREEPNEAGDLVENIYHEPYENLERLNLETGKWVPVTENDVRDLAVVEAAKKQEKPVEQPPVELMPVPTSFEHFLSDPHSPVRADRQSIEAAHQTMYNFLRSPERIQVRDALGADQAARLVEEYLRYINVDPERFGQLQKDVDVTGENEAFYERLYSNMGARIAPEQRSGLKRALLGDIDKAQHAANLIYRFSTTSPFLSGLTPEARMRLAGILSALPSELANIKLTKNQNPRLG